MPAWCLIALALAAAVGLPPLAAAAPPAPATVEGGGDDPLALLPADSREAVARQLERAGERGAALRAIIRPCPAGQRPALAFLLANMPEGDLKSLPPDALAENVDYAWRAWREAPWSASVPEEVFLNDVLPYASINERRDRWRKDFFQRFRPWVKDCKTPGEAALVLNGRLFKEVNVRYHPTKRPKPDQSPYESMECGYASCSGLSVLLVDACRAAGVPARFVGTPAWTTGKGDANGNHGGNHSWVEVWDGQWHVLGASEVTGLDQTWFMGNASKADPSEPIHRIYATSFRRMGEHFPLAWDGSIDWVSAEDVTQSYLKRTPVKLSAGGASASAPVRVRITAGGRLVADFIDDGTGHELTLSAGQPYLATLAAASGAGGGEQIPFTAPGRAGEAIALRPRVP